MGRGGIGGARSSMKAPTAAHKRRGRRDASCTQPEAPGGRGGSVMGGSVSAAIRSCGDAGGGRIDNGVTGAFAMRAGLRAGALPCATDAVPAASSASAMISEASGSGSLSIAAAVRSFASCAARKTRIVSCSSRSSCIFAKPAGCATGARGTENGDTTCDTLTATTTAATATAAVSRGLDINSAIWNCNGLPHR